MSEIQNSFWITDPAGFSDAARTFTKTFTAGRDLVSAVLEISALGTYAAFINGRPVQDFIFAPGWTNYTKRVQYQSCDITDFIKAGNTLKVNVGQLWRYHERSESDTPEFKSTMTAVICALTLSYGDGTTEILHSDGSWLVTENRTRYNNIYCGETYDSTYEEKPPVPVKVLSYTRDILIPQEGEPVREHERFTGKKLIHTPKGETVIDFGQEITGYVNVKFQCRRGDKLRIRHFEVLDKDGNVYTENLRGAKQEVNIVCDGALHDFKPAYTFYGFRYICIEGFPVNIAPKNFTAVAVYSDLKRTGSFSCSDKLIDRLMHNVVWGQKGNYLDVPTDCPQRDERLGWTGDAQVFCRTAAYLCDVKRFFTKWLNDMESEFEPARGIPHVIPRVGWDGFSSAAWADSAVIIPWRLYTFYGDRELLAHQYSLMKKWNDYVAQQARKETVPDGFDKSRDPYLWNTGSHFGDWLALDHEGPDCPGATDKDYIASAYFAYTTSLMVKADRALGLDESAHAALHDNIVSSMRREYMAEDGSVKGNDTQCALVLALAFDITADRAATGERLLERLKKDGHMTTGFVSTCFLPHVLSAMGHTKEVYDLLLRTEYPSWLYPVTMGATTVWERWDGIRPDGSFQSASMNSFNHYAYGAVADWLYGNMAGIQPDEDEPGFAHVVFRPETDERVKSVRASVDSVRGTIASGWSREGGRTVYTFTVPEGVRADAVIDGEKIELTAGTHVIKR